LLEHVLHLDTTTILKITLIITTLFIMTILITIKTGD
jgi:hypothetical protein